jgi:arginase
LTFDIDGIDPAFAPGTGTRAKGGLTYREAHYICEALAEKVRLVGMDIVEVNPALDRKHLASRVGEGHEHGDNPLISTTLPTVSLAIELVASALGKTILL